MKRAGSRGHRAWKADRAPTAAAGWRRGSLQSERLVEMRYVPASDGHGLMGLRVGGEEQRSLEARFYLPDSADIDQEPAVDAEEPLAFELPFAAGRGHEWQPAAILDRSSAKHVAVGLGEANLARIEHDPPLVPHSDHAAGERARRGIKERIVRAPPKGGFPPGEPKASSMPITWVPAATGRTETGTGAPGKARISAWIPSIGRPGGHAPRHDGPAAAA